MVPQNSAPRNAPTKPTVASRPASAWLRPNSRATGGSAMPNNAKSQASNITPRKHSANRLRCQRENGSRSSRPTSSADFAEVSAMSFLPARYLSAQVRAPREVNNEADVADKHWSGAAEYVLAAARRAP